MPAGPAAGVGRAGTGAEAVRCSFPLRLARAAGDGSSGASWRLVYWRMVGRVYAPVGLTEVNREQERIRTRSSAAAGRPAAAAAAQRSALSWPRARSPQPQPPRLPAQAAQLGRPTHTRTAAPAHLALALLSSLVLLRQRLKVHKTSSRYISTSTSAL